MIHLLKIPAVAIIAIACLGLSAGTTSAGAPAPEQLIVYDCAANGPGTGTEICSVNPDGSGFANLTNNPLGDSGPEISPDGKHIAWRHDISELWIMDPDGGNPRNVADPDVLTSFGEPTWSPDSKRLAARCNNPDNLSEDGFCIVDIATGAVQYGYTIEFYTVEDLSWSPDGKRILFSGEQISGGADLHVLDLELGVAQNITQSDGVNEWGTWSPGGAEIAFVGNGIPDDGTNTFPNLYRIDPDGDNRELLYDGSSLGPAHSNPAYSPDGTLIAWFCSDSEPSARDLCINKADGGGLMNLFTEGDNGLVIGSNPDWGYVGGPIFGDFDCDGDVDGDDLLILLQTVGVDSFGDECVSLGGNEVNGHGQDVRDLNCDSEVDALDGLPVLFLLIGTPSIHPDCTGVGSAARIFEV